MIAKRKAFFFLVFTASVVRAFTSIHHQNKCRPSLPRFAAEGDELKAEGQTKEGDNKAMAFLRKIGKVGRVDGQDFGNAMGIDEGPAGKSSTGVGSQFAVRKAKSAYTSCVDSGILDDMSEDFPISSSGTLWSGSTDRVMGGKSYGSITREEAFEGRKANVLRGKVSLENNGGFIQMATDLALDPSVSSTVDASKYNGIELDVFCPGEGENEYFNLHLKNSDCTRQFSSYRATFEIKKGEWETVRLPWSLFQGKGLGIEDSSSFDVSTLRRLGVVAIGKEMDVVLALSGLRFYTENA